MVDVDGIAEMLDSVSRSDIRKPMEAHPSLARRGYLSDGKFNTLASPLLMPLPLSPTRTQEKNLSWESIPKYLKMAIDSIYDSDKLAIMQNFADKNKLQLKRETFKSWWDINGQKKCNRVHIESMSMSTLLIGGIAGFSGPSHCCFATNKLSNLWWWNYYLQISALLGEWPGLGVALVGS